MTLASEVTVTRPDGTVEKQPANKPKATPAKARRPARRGPAICAMCGYPIIGTVRVSQEQGPARGKPVHSVCEDKATSFAAEKRVRKAKAKEVPAATRSARSESLAEENRKLFARQNEIRQRQKAAKQTRSS